MTRSWTIEPIPLYRFQAPGPEVLFQRSFGEMIEMIIYAFLLQSEGMSILVDTGLPANYAVLNAKMIERKGPSAGFFPVGQGLAAELTKRAVTPGLIVVTSFGPYAVGGLEVLAEPPLVVSARGLADLERPEEPALIHPLSPSVKEALTRGRSIDREAEIAPGILFLETGIHHPASAAIVIQTTDGRIAIADPVFCARNLLEGVALGAAENLAGWHGMVRMLAARSDAIIPVHDLSPMPVRREAWHHSIGSPVRT